MKIVLMHYHLKPGGVTTVIKQQCQALKGHCHILILTGEVTDPVPDLDARVVTIPGLGYDAVSDIQHHPGDVAEAVIEAIHGQWPDGCDVVHVHNPTLAKNRNFLKILKHLQKNGIRLLLQIHDFAEDGRPGVYFEAPYPENCHYAVLNSRDYHILLSAGLKREGLHLLPNMVSPLDLEPAKSPFDAYVLYPIRAIRRKNIGEAILWATLMDQGQSLIITLPPNSPADFGSYHDWKAFARENRLQVMFEAGLTNDFHALVHGADAVITTSITEGFGYCFLEPWTAGKWLWGRGLPDICQDFEAKGVRLDHLYSRLRFPLEGLDADAFQKTWMDAVHRVMEQFGIAPDSYQIHQTFKSLSAHGTIDFGLLSEPFQRQGISELLSRKTVRDRFKQLNPVAFFPDKDRIANNNRIIRNHFQESIYQRNLLNMYTHVCNKPVQQYIDKTRLLNQFLNLDQFSLLKWEPYHG